MVAHHDAICRARNPDAELAMRNIPRPVVFRLPWSIALAVGLLPAAYEQALAATNLVTVNADGLFTPPRVEIFSGDTVEWHFAKRGSSIIPVSFTAGSALCTNYLPYRPADPNEFTGPMPRAVSGIFALSPEDSPYAMQDAIWQSTNLTGVFIRMRWNDVHLGTNRFNWSEMDALIEEAVNHGKVYSLGFKAGHRGTPQWIFSATSNAAPVTPLDFGLTQAGRPSYLGSPADPNFRKHYFDLLTAAAAHLRERNAYYRALAYIKISGANLISHENRLTNDTAEAVALWAGPGHYRPANLYSFYHEQTALLAAEFPEKDMSYALIQDGFPIINGLGEYAGQSAPTNASLPKGSEQTEYVLNQGRLEQGRRFVVQHNGLQSEPAFCPDSGVHPTVVDPNFHYVGSGCPNRWVLEQSSLGQVTGFQIVAGITNLGDLESTFANQWDNSDGVFLEIYEGNALSAELQGLPSGKRVGDWAEQFHERRRETVPSIPEPFPLTYSHTFTRTAASDSGPQVFYYLDPARCSTGDATHYGSIAILPDLSFTSVSRATSGAVSLRLAVAHSGTLKVESATDLAGWTLLDSRSTAGGTVEVTDPSAAASERFYRATLVTP
jgi:hypothetical protein